MAALPPAEPLARRLDAEPLVFRGCTASELKIILIAATAFWVPLCLVLGGIAGLFTIGLGAAVLAIVLTTLAAPRGFQSLKRGRPDGWYQQRTAIALDRLGLRRSGLVARGGLWDIGRTR